ncbi:translation initiation factor eIF5A [Coemansia guatemalensis]|uniref:Translation initiation factor eIF5A n=1 Tax=Coemansia guatemalensis TaxID=2761395 RepID=A0A9W8LUB7_9FUNG|nr:translation initiation factor eIF5A [Coemansia guatemalensis]
MVSSKKTGAKASSSATPAAAAAAPGKEVDAAAAHDVAFDSADSGAAKTFPMQCSALRKNGHVVIKGRPCKIIDMSTSKTGKHGHAKVHLVATDIFNNKKYEDISPSTHNMDVPNIVRKDYLLLDVGEKEDPFVSYLFDEKTGEDKSIKAPSEEMRQKLAGFIDAGTDINITILSAMGEEALMEYKTVNTNPSK